jgi:hypothetical protein
MVGIKVKWEDLFEDQLVPGCEHKHAHKFCPECGKPASQEKRVPIFTEDAEYDSDMDAFKGLQLFRPYEHDEAFLGKILGHASGDNYEEKSTELFPASNAFDEVIAAKRGTKFEHSKVRLWTILSTSP